MSSEVYKSTVYFDGLCPLRRAEIGHYGRQDTENSLRFVDVSKTTATLPVFLTQQQAMKRFHVLAGNGRLVSGATAFVDVWRRLPRWRWAARVASLPEAMTILEFGYRLFLPVRPIVSRRQSFPYLNTMTSKGQRYVRTNSERSLVS
jgi:predicted DCC family thiol-disulfide oxidoreductase YuxK